MKKLLSLLLALSLLLSLAGCVTTPETPTTDLSISTTVSDESVEITTSSPPESTQVIPEETKQDVLTPSQTRPVQTDPPETRPPQTDPPVQTDPPAQTQPPQPTVPTTQTEATTLPETEPTQPTTPSQTQPSYELDPNGSYTTKEDVALYIHLYGKLPGNFITKSQARAYGWKKGSLERYAPGKCIGGDVFRNQEGLLPAGHSYFECDIDTLGSLSGRGSKRIVFSSDGLVYYTGDHYRSFELLYGEP